MAVFEEIELLIGTYEDYVLGYQVERSKPGANKRKRGRQINGDAAEESPKISSTPDSSKQTILLEQSFAVRSHSGSVKCLARSENGFLAYSAGHDEMTNLFNLQKRKLLQTSEGAINCALFIGNKHLIAASEDGNIYIYECKSSSYTLAKTLGGHKEGVVSIDAHPSGKILLSISKDHSMRTWNLIKGRCAYVTHIKSNAHLVKWSKTGDDFLLVANDEMVIYNREGNLRHDIKFERRVNSIEFLTDDMFVVATDSGRLEFIDLNKGILVMKFQAHQTRIKSMQCFKSDELLSDGSTIKLATASSDGSVKVWSVEVPLSKEPGELANVDIGARLTCMVSCVRKLGN